MKRDYILMIMCLISFIPVATALNSDSYAVATHNDIKIEWVLLKDYSSNKEYDVNIYNYQNVDRVIPLELYFKDSNVNANIYFYEYTNKTIIVESVSEKCTETTLLNGSKKVSCTDIITEEKSHVGYWEKIQPSTTFNEDGTVIRFPIIKLEKNTSFPTTTDEYRIVREKGKKTFKIIIKDINPIIYNQEIALRNYVTGDYYHPIINSSFYSADFENDGNNANTIKTAILLNTSDLAQLESKNNIYLSKDLADISGSIINDLSPKNNDGIMMNSPSLVSGKINTSLNYNTGDYVNVSDSASLDFGTNDLSVSFWMNKDTLGDSSDVIIVKTSATFGTPGFWIGIGNKKERLKFSLHDGSTQCNTVFPEGGTDMITGQWYHFVINMDRDGNATIYRDGVSIDSISISACSNSLNSNFALSIGALPGGTQGFDGSIDEVSIWNRTLSTDEISVLYNDGSGVNFWKGNEIYKSNIFSTGQNHNRFVPTFICSGTCLVNVTTEGENFNDVQSGQQYNISSVDGNTTFNYSITLSHPSNIQYLNITFSEYTETNNAPSQFGLKTPLNNSRYDQYNISNLIFSWYNASDTENNSLTYVVNIFNETSLIINKSTNELSYINTTLPTGNYTWNMTVTDGTTTNTSNQTRTFEIANLVLPLTNLSFLDLHVQCLKYEGCFDGRNKCLLVIRNDTNEIIDTNARDLDCNEFKSKNPVLLVLLTLLGMGLIYMGARHDMSLIGLFGCFGIVLVGLLIINTWTLIAMFIITLFIFFAMIFASDYF